MTDSLTAQGLSVKNNATLLAEIQDFIQNTYSPNGEPIDFSSASPDGQFTNILATIGTTHRELLTQVYNATDPTKCIGTQQDSKYQLNYLWRSGGTYTIQNIDITATKTVTLQGLDGSYNENTASAFTVSDNSGNIWYLIDTATIQAGTSSLPFRAQKKGAVTPTIGTITNIVTVTGGIVDVNNNVGFTSLGVEQESNIDFMLRRDRSTAISGGNSTDTIYSRILALQGVTDCQIDDNRTNTTDEQGTESKTLWVIVNGGANLDIADIIYSNIAGSETRGDVLIPIQNMAGQVVNIRFDRPTLVPFYVKFDLQATAPIGEINTTQIKEYIGNNLIYKLGEDLETSKATEICADGVDNAGGRAYALNVEISSGGTATADISTSKGITSASVISSTFQDALGDTTETYTFTYSNNTWKLNDKQVDIADYGISVVGTPQDDDLIIVNFTAGTWTDFIKCQYISNIFVTDAKKIYINVVQ